jgi:hypothetical protein
VRSQWYFHIGALFFESELTSFRFSRLGRNPELALFRSIENDSVASDLQVTVVAQPGFIGPEHIIALAQKVRMLLYSRWLA